MAINLKLKDMPQYGRIMIMAVPALILAALFIVLIYTPRTKEIKTLDSAIEKLDSEIATAEVKTRRLAELKKENEKLKMQLAELKLMMPEEREVSALLKQVSDSGLTSGLAILLWKPSTKTGKTSKPAAKTSKKSKTSKTSPDEQGYENIYVEIPVDVEMLGEYHNFGVFFSYVSRLKRIVNIKNIKMASEKKKETTSLIKANFTASTFSAVNEEEIKAEDEKEKQGEKGKKPKEDKK